MSFDNNIVVIKLNTVDTPISFPSQETNCTQCHFKFRASANEAAANLFSFAAVIRVVTRHATLLPTKWGGALQSSLVMCYVLFLSGKNKTIELYYYCFNIITKNTNRSGAPNDCFL